jgi:hypothetical protein
MILAMAQPRLLQMSPDARGGNLQLTKSWATPKAAAWSVLLPDVAKSAAMISAVCA